MIIVTLNIITLCCIVSEFLQSDRMFLYSRKRMSVSQQNLDRNRRVLSSRRNVGSDVETVIVVGRSFHALAAAAGKTVIHC